MLLSESLEQFLNYLEFEQQASVYTLRDYAHYLGRFADFCTSCSPAVTLSNKITKKILKNYHAYLDTFVDNRGLPLKRVTKAYHLIALRSYIDYLSTRKETKLTRHAIVLPLFSRLTPTTVQNKDLERLLSLSLSDTKQGLRDKAILELLYSCGITVSELVGLSRPDIDFDKREITVTRRGKRRQIVFSNRTLLWLRRYVLSRPDHYKPVFIRYAGKTVDPHNADKSLRLTARSVQRLLKKYAKEANIPLNLTPQSIRHTVAVNLLKRGLETSKVQKLLGHKHRTTTEIYEQIASK